MPIVPNTDKNNAIIKVVNSKTIEFISAIHVLSDSRHHGFESEWADNIYKQLSRKSLVTLSKLSDFTYNGLEYLEFPFRSGIYDDIEKFLAYLNDLSNDEYVYLLFRNVLKSHTIKMVVEKRCIDKLTCDEPILNKFNKETLDYILYNTDTFKKEILDLMNELLQNNDFMSKLDNALLECKDAVEQMKIDALNTEPEELMNKAMRKKWPLEKFSEYIFAPSYFMSPHHAYLIFNDTIIIAYDARYNEENIKESNLKIANKLTALTDKTRLEIIRILISGPNYNKVLSAMLNLSTATISHHLEILRKAELVTERQYRKMRIYNANIDEINTLMDSLKNYLFNK